MSDPHLLVERQGHIVVATMNRPRSRNAFSLEMLVRMWDCWQMVDEDKDVRCLVLTGAGGTFSAGADLKLMHGDQSDNPYQARLKEDPDLHWKALWRHYRMKKPVVAAVEGYALGGGTEILQATDIRVAAETATFGVTETALGLFPLGGSTVRLRRQIPHTIAMEMLLTGKRISAQQALEYGLIGSVVAEGKALESAIEIAEKIARNGPIAVQAVKASVLASEGLTEAEALAKELEIGQPVFRTKDAREGPRAFAERRKPVFTGE